MIGGSLLKKQKKKSSSSSSADEEVECKRRDKRKILGVAAGVFSILLACVLFSTTSSTGGVSTPSSTTDDGGGSTMSSTGDVPTPSSSTGGVPTPPSMPTTSSTNGGSGGIDHCSPDPCENGGSCTTSGTDATDYYTCACATGYQGRNCATVDNCNGAVGHLYHEGTNGKLTSASLGYGASVANMGDLDGNGFADVAVGDPDDNAVYITRLGLAFSVVSVVKLAHQENGVGTINEGDNFGKSVKALEDIDGDGVMDLAVTSPLKGRRNIGAVYLLTLNTDDTVKTVNIINRLSNMPGDIPPRAFFGSDVAPLGDLNNDGNLDLAVGAVGDGDFGAVYIVFLGGAELQPLSTTNRLDGGDISSEILHPQFGHAVVSLGDVDGDGVGDIAVGAPLGGGAEGGGMVVIMFLNTEGMASGHQEISSAQGLLNPTTSMTSNDRFGYSITAVGDIDGNGVTDIAVGSIGRHEYEGALYVLKLKKSGRVGGGQEISSAEGGLDPDDIGHESKYGTAVAFMGDMNGDGLFDLAVGGKATTVGGVSQSGYVDFLQVPLGFVACDGDNVCASGDGKHSCLPGSARVPKWSWDTLPTYWHAKLFQFTQPQLDAIGQYPMATVARDPHGEANMEERIADACASINNGYTKTFFYLNSMINWHGYNLYNELVDNSQYRMKDADDGSDFNLGDLIKTSSSKHWLFDFTNPEIREKWIQTALESVDAGSCTGVYIDRGKVQVSATKHPDMHAANPEWEAMHQATIAELEERLAARGASSIINNNLMASPHRTIAMIEDFEASGRCIDQLLQLAKNGMGVEAHSETYNEATGLYCEEGDINGMAAFLIGMGRHMYFHCSHRFVAKSGWPKNRQNRPAAYWFPWEATYSRKLGKPTGLATLSPNKEVWSRDFYHEGLDSTTHVTFNLKKGKGVITWADGTVSTGFDGITSYHNSGCKNEATGWSGKGPSQI